MAYDAAGRLKSVTDALDRQTKFETDFKERITAIVDALGHRKAFEYDGNGKLVNVTEGDAVTALTYDGSGRLTSVTDPEGNATTFEYAAAGCSSCGGSTAIPESVTDPFGNATRNIFDKNGQIAAIEDPLANLTGLTRDALGRVIGRTDGNGNTVNFEYDPLGRLVKQIDAARGVTAFTYDKRGNLLTLSDPEGNVTTFEYDLAGRKTKEVRPMGETTTYAYYANGLLDTVTDAKGQTTSYTYDAGGLLTAVTYADGKRDAFAYDAVGNMTSWTGADGISGTMTYDELNRKLTEQVDYGSFNKTIAYTYDARGNKATYTSPEGITTTYEYRKNNQLSSISVDGKIIDLQYDRNRLARKAWPGGVTDYQYNANGWLTGINAANSTGTFLSYQYGFDKVGNILNKSTEHGTYAYTYDPTYQLTGADNPKLPDESYSYDKVGNRLTSLDIASSWSYNQNNELIGNSQATYEYDANGNTVKKTEGGEVTSYVYNARNRLEKVYLPDGRVASYAYDPFGRRIKKQVANTVTYFAYAEEGLVGDGANALIYALRGDYTNASLSAAAMIPFAGWAATGGKFAGKLAKKGKPIIVGENMKRVKEYAEMVGGHAYSPWKNEPWDGALGMRRNERWIKDQMRNGREVIDIGPDFQRRAEKGYRSEFYEMERRNLKGYDNYTKVFDRNGNEGGVPGLDY